MILGECKCTQKLFNLIGPAVNPWTMETSSRELEFNSDSVVSTGAGRSRDLTMSKQKT